MEKQFYIYILTNNHHNVVYVGITNDILRRIEEHKNVKGGFAYKYNCHKLVYFEEFDNPQSAIDREKQIKNWSRSKKDHLIAKLNPELDDLSSSLS